MPSVYAVGLSCSNARGDSPTVLPGGAGVAAGAAVCAWANKRLAPPWGWGAFMPQKWR